MPLGDALGVRDVFGGVLGGVSAAGGGAAYVAVLLSLHFFGGVVMAAAVRSVADLRLAVLVAVRSPAKFDHAAIADAVGCPVELVDEIAEKVKTVNPEPTNPMTLEQIGSIIGISSSGVRAAEHVAIMKLRHPRRAAELKPYWECRCG